MLNLHDDAWVSSPSSDKEGCVENVVFVDETKVFNCMMCPVKFSIIIKKHHCRCCGLVFCGSCSRNKSYIIEGIIKRIRFCEKCGEKYEALLEVNVLAEEENLRWQRSNRNSGNTFEEEDEFNKENESFNNLYQEYLTPERKMRKTITPKTYSVRTPPRLRNPTEIEPKTSPRAYNPSSPIQSPLNRRRDRLKRSLPLKHKEDDIFAWFKAGSANVKEQQQQKPFQTPEYPLTPHTNNSRLSPDGEFALENIYDCSPCVYDHGLNSLLHVVTESPMRKDPAKDTSPNSAFAIENIYKTSSPQEKQSQIESPLRKYLVLKKQQQALTEKLILGSSTRKWSLGIGVMLLLIAVLVLYLPNAEEEIKNFDKFGTKLNEEVDLRGRPQRNSSVESIREVIAENLRDTIQHMSEKEMQVVGESSQVVVYDNYQIVEMEFVMPETEEKGFLTISMEPKPTAADAIRRFQRMLLAPVKKVVYLPVVVLGFWVRLWRKILKTVKGMRPARPIYPPPVLYRNEDPIHHPSYFL